jgi:hypothetical protein
MSSLVSSLIVTSVMASSCACMYFIKASSAPLLVLIAIAFFLTMASFMYLVAVCMNVVSSLHFLLSTFGLHVCSVSDVLIDSCCWLFTKSCCFSSCSLGFSLAGNSYVLLSLSSSQSELSATDSEMDSFSVS